MGEGEPCPARLRIQPLRKLQTMGLAVPSPVERERVRVRVNLLGIFGNLNLFRISDLEDSDLNRAGFPNRRASLAHKNPQCFRTAIAMLKRALEREKMRFCG